MSEGHVLPVYRHLLSLWLQRLVRAGVLERRGDAFVAIAPVGQAVDASGAGPAVLTSDAVPILRDYLKRCDQQMPAIVTGRQGPLETLFPGGSFETADFFYRDWGLARYYNGILGTVAETLRRRFSDRPLRILEIGAGSGGTTSSLLPILDEGETEYWFTDVSEHFFDRAERTFADFPFVRFHRFDLDQEPMAQGIPRGQFDLVVAANSVHATKDLGRAIEHARALLAPGGLLLLYEVTTHLDWFEMSVALIEGWQHHEDRLRGETPLLPPELWVRALRERDFERVAFFPPLGSPASVLGHHIIVAAAPGIPVAMPAPVSSVAVARRTEPGTAAVDAAVPSIRARLEALTQGERKDLLQQLVQRQVMRVMRLPANAPPPGINDRLMSIGVDSLMAVELKGLLLRELERAVDVPSTLIFDYPTIAAIALHLLGSLGFHADEAQAGVDLANQPAHLSDAAAIAGLSEADVEALLTDRLRELPE
jgi:SAM-dependent methyltransferase